MTGTFSRPVGIQDVLSIAEIGYAIMGLLKDHDDLYSACLTSKHFYAVARPYLWRRVDLPYLTQAPDVRLHKQLERRQLNFRVYAASLWPCCQIQIQEKLARLQEELTWQQQQRLERLQRRRLNAPTSSREGSSAEPGQPQTKPFWERFSFELGRFTKSLSVDTRVVAFDVFNDLGPWALFPRTFDLLILLQRHCSAIESVDIEARIDDRYGLQVLSDDDPNYFLRLYDVEDPDHFQKPLDNMRNLGLDPNLAAELVFDFPNLRILSLTNLHCDKFRKSTSAFQAPLVSILKASPNLRYLGLSSNSEARGYKDYDDGRTRGMFEMLCLMYKTAGGKPLRLKGLRLGEGCGLLDPGQDSGGSAHYLCNLTHLDCLEKLHLENLYTAIMMASRGQPIGSSCNKISVWCKNATCQNYGSSHGR
ncbi:hypothetical protein VTK56DRAFT_8343 [Thermocarpiscus australiensis]